MRKAKLFKRALGAALSMALIGNVMCAQAKELPVEDIAAENVMEWIDIPVEEFVIEEEASAGDMEISFPESKSVESVGEFADEAYAVSLTGDEISLNTDDGIQTINAENKAGEESVLNSGSASGYLSETGEYALYSLNLSEGNYLQARLTVPNNTSINYALALYDAELNVIKMSHYIPYLNEGKTLEESIGYLSASDELVYIGIVSLVGGSTTESYTLDFSVLTNFSNFSDTSEPNENAQEAVALNLGNAGTDVSGMLNSAVDNDWYSFTVIDSPKYNKIRLNLTSNSAANGCRMEIYRNLGEDYFIMELGGSGTGEVETELSVGTYYVRVVSTNTLNDFNPADIPAYNLSVVPVSKVNKIKITKYTGSGGGDGVAYDLYDGNPNWVNIVGLAYYEDSMGNKTGAANVKLKVQVVNTSWKLKGRPDKAITYITTVTRDDGFFYGTVYLYEVVGLNYDGDVYDNMSVEICPLYDPEIKAIDYFKLIKKLPN